MDNLGNRSQPQHLSELVRERNEEFLEMLSIDSTSIVGFSPEEEKRIINLINEFKETLSDNLEVNHTAAKTHVFIAQKINPEGKSDINVYRAQTDGEGNILSIDLRSRIQEH